MKPATKQMLAATLTVATAGAIGIGVGALTTAAIMKKKNGVITADADPYVPYDPNNGPLPDVPAQSCIDQAGDILTQCNADCASLPEDQQDACKADCADWNALDVASCQTDPQCTTQWMAAQARKTKLARVAHATHS